MQIAPEIVSAVIAALGAGLAILIRDIVVRFTRERAERQRALTQMRIERAYAPLEYLIHRVVHTDDPAQQTAYLQEIAQILRQHSYLLSEPVISALYTFLDDPNAGAALIQAHFTDEFIQLKQQFYQTWDSARSTGTGRRRRWFPARHLGLWRSS